MLKRIISVFITIICMCGYLYSQDTAKVVVPQEVKNMMIAHYPQTQEVPVTWSLEGKYYKGSLMIMGKPAAIVFDSTGKIIRSEKRIHQTYLPKKIVSQLNTEFPGFVYGDIYEFETAGVKTYKVSFQVIKTTIYNPDGTIVKPGK